MKKILVLSSVMFSTPSIATDYKLEVCAIQSHNNGDTAFLRACGTSWESKNGCSNNSWVAWDTSTHSGQAMYSTALTAISLGALVTIRLDGESCLGGYDATSMIRLTRP